MKLLLKLILNRFILSILIMLFFAMDYKMIALNPFQTYSVKRPPETVIANNYYVIEFGETDIYVEVTYLDNHIHLVPKSSLPSAAVELKQPVLAWYYYGLALALANIIPFGWFTKTKKQKKRKK